MLHSYVLFMVQFQVQIYTGSQGLDNIVIRKKLVKMLQMLSLFTSPQCVNNPFNVLECCAEVLNSAFV